MSVKAPVERCQFHVQVDGEICAHFHISLLLQLENECIFIQFTINWFPTAEAIQDVVYDFHKQCFTFEIADR